MSKSKLEIDWRGKKSWYLNGKLHREDGPAVEIVDEYEAWYKNGKIHRIDGPAIIFLKGTLKGTWQWRINGFLHRTNGPAAFNHRKEKEWWLNGIMYTKEKWFNQLTIEQQYDYFWNLDEE